MRLVRQRSWVESDRTCLFFFFQTRNNPFQKTLDNYCLLMFCQLSCHIVEFFKVFLHSCSLYLCYLYFCKPCFLIFGSFLGSFLSAY